MLKCFIRTSVPVKVVLLNPHYTVFTDQGSVVGNVPWYGFDGTRIEFRWRKVFRSRPDRQQIYIRSQWIVVAVSNEQDLLQQATRTYTIRRPHTCDGSYSSYFAVRRGNCVMCVFLNCTDRWFGWSYHEEYVVQEM